MKKFRKEKSYLAYLLVTLGLLSVSSVACTSKANRGVASADLGMRNFTAPCDLRTAHLDDVNSEVQNYVTEGFKLVSVQKLTRSQEQTYPSNTCSFIFVRQ